MQFCIRLVSTAKCILILNPICRDPVIRLAIEMVLSKRSSATAAIVPTTRPRPVSLPRLMIQLITTLVLQDILTFYFIFLHADIHRLDAMMVAAAIAVALVFDHSLEVTLGLALGLRMGVESCLACVRRVYGCPRGRLRLLTAASVLRHLIE